VQSINWLAGFADSAREVPTAERDDALRHLQSVHLGREPSVEEASGLLGNFVGYETAEDSSVGSLASFSIDKVSIPCCGAVPVPIVERLRGEPRRMLEDWKSELLRPESEQGAIFENSCDTGCQSDSKLRHSNRAFLSLVELLWRGGLLTPVRRSQGRVGIFFVRKKNGRLHMVLDFRRVNQFFKDPPQIPMGTGAAWTSLRVPPDAVQKEGSYPSGCIDPPFYIALQDIRDYFYACGSLGP